MTNRGEQTTARERMHAGLQRHLDSVIVAFIINVCLPVHGTENVLYCRENLIFRECKFYDLVLVLITVIYCVCIRKVKLTCYKLRLVREFTD